MLSGVIPFATRQPTALMPSVLIVDPNPELRRFVAFLLTSAGHAVREATGIRAAVALLRESPSDVLLTELVEPLPHAAETVEAIGRDFPSLDVVPLASLSYAAGCLRLCAALDGPRTTERPFTKRETMAFVTEMIAGLAAHTAHVRHRSERDGSSQARA
jgi:CheY-like chemotaxis protein